MPFRDHFRGKRVAVIGLGPHGEMAEDVKFLIKAGALVSVYDLRSEARVNEHLLPLREMGLANYICGSIPEEDLLDMDLIIISHDYPRGSGFLKGPREKGIPIEYQETLFFRLAPPMTVVGVMGAAGTSTVVSMLAPLLEAACKAHESQGFFTIDPDSGGGILAHLRKATSGDIVLARIIAPMMVELYDMRISPHVAVFTTLVPKGSYRGSPFEILSYQTYNNFIVGSDEVIDATRAYSFLPRAKMLRTKASIIPSEWRIAARGPHDRDNAALALEVARLFKVSDDDAQRILERRASLKGRLEPVKKVRGAEYYNDSAAVSPSATILAVRALSGAGAEKPDTDIPKNILLIMGGADGGADYGELLSILPQHVRALILVPGSGTMRQRPALTALEGVAIHSAPSLEEAVRTASEHAVKGDIVLFSPGFPAAGIDRSREERGERFVRTVRSL